MAYSGSGYGAGEGFFGGFAGGYNRTPAGQIVYSGPGSNLPSVNPNNFPGTVHFGPSTTILGSPSISVPVTGQIDPYYGGFPPAAPYPVAGVPLPDPSLAGNLVYPGAYSGAPY